MLDSRAKPRVVVFRPPPGKRSFGSVQVLEDRRREVILWDVFSNRDLLAESVYTGFIPPDYVCNLLDVELRMLQYPA